MEKVYLTKLAPNCGCAAKVGPGTLAGVLCKLPKFHDEHLLVGTETSDDAAVYKISDELAMIQTLDFFTPVADDPYDFGQIAAANALSDVYAMGGEPKTALNIVARSSREAQTKYWRQAQFLQADIRSRTTHRSMD